MSYLRPAIKRAGGKRYLYGSIIRRLPGHRIYVEPYAGGLNVLWNKRRARIEVAGDKDAGLMNFYAVLRDRTRELLARVVPLIYCRETFEWARAHVSSGDDEGKVAAGRGSLAQPALPGGASAARAAGARMIALGGPWRP
jgi:site-specific DNA-adenine methylase